MRHHIIPKHEWKKRFGNFIGFNAPDNTVDLNTAQHAQVHQHYFDEITHIEYDRIAAWTISGQIGKEEAQRRVARIANLGNKHKTGFKCSDEFKQFTSMRMRGKRYGLGTKRSDESRQLMSAAMRGNSNSLGVKRPLVTCSHCDKVGGLNSMKRWHFDNCRKRKI
jgi:hypothetical protein